MTQSPELTPERFFSLPELFPIELAPGKASFVPMDRESYRRSIFTDRGRIQTAQRQGWDIPLMGLVQDFEARGGIQRPINYIFHVAHCGSTLLARALDLPGRTLVTREPFALRQLAAQAAARPQGVSDPDGWSRCLRLITGLLGRTFDEGEHPVVKANVPVNFILEPLMAVAEGNRGIALYAGLDRYLLSVLKTPRHRQWVGNVLRQLAGGIAGTPPLTAADLNDLSAPRAAACLWLAQHYRFAAALESDPRLASLDCEDLFSRPAEVLVGACAHFGLDVPTDDIEAVVTGGLFQRHAKDLGRPFDSAAREAELATLRETMAGELADARAWAEAILARAPLRLPLPRPLLAPGGDAAPAND